MVQISVLGESIKIRKRLSIIPHIFYQVIYSERSCVQLLSTVPQKMLLCKPHWDFFVAFEIWKTLVEKLDPAFL